jgi:type III pantothenate kinase
MARGRVEPARLIAVNAVTPLLAVDIGNSRIKWGVCCGRRWVARGAVDHDQAGELQTAWADLPADCRAIGSNVAGSDAAERIEALLSVRERPIRWIESPHSQCGVRNRYDDPARLGTDRWAALIAARSMETHACLVVNAGTGVTVDALAANGDFLGGLILPGLRLMGDALARFTSRLGREAGSYAAFPRNTADAIASGAIEAVAGAAERMRARLGEVAHGPVQVIASGGSIEALASHLPPNARLVENLVLEGLVIIAAES